MKVADVSALFFDIESTGLAHDENSKVLLISNTFVKNGVVERKLFAYDDYENEADLFVAWNEWVQYINPSIIAGYNIFGYDLPYMRFCADKAGTELRLGRDGSPIYFSKKPSKFRKDGSQDYEYNRCYIFGREIVDIMFVAYHFDFKRKYVSYALKQIIKQENLEVAGRQHYDASKIFENYKDPVEWAKIKQYAIHDADDAHSLYNLMIAAYFYLTPSIPKTFQAINYSASGSQINAFLIRSYLQNGHSLPKTTDAYHFEGAISLGNPGVYKWVYKVDVASLYPSIMLQYDIWDRDKDPKAHFIKMVDYFTQERLVNKQRGKETGERYYKDLEQAQKIVINSAYGMLGATGLLFNSPKNGEYVTAMGREILTKAINWATENCFDIVNADTDSISITDHEEMTPEFREEIDKAINSLYPDKIRWEDDGYYPAAVVLKAKNYSMKNEKGEIIIKGSALKSSKIEKALKEFMDKIVTLLLEGKKEQVLPLYNQYIKECYNVTDISRWTSKITVTEAVLGAGRTREAKVFEAIQGENIQMGNKFWVYHTMDEKLKLQ
jgi:DNA polymerase, archaea type